MLDLDRFTTELHRVLPREGNLFVSPLSIGIALAMVHVGARGETAGTTGRVLDLPSDPDEAARVVRDVLAALAPDANDTPTEAGDSESGIEAPRRFGLAVANALFGQESHRFHTRYIDRLRRAFDAMVETLDFGEAEAAAARINTWVREKTREMIPTIVSPQDLGPAVVCALVNAAHFLAAWQVPFEPSATRPGPFSRTESGGGEVEVPMMTVEVDAPWMRDDRLGFSAAAIPYVGAHMLVVLPDTGRFRAVEDALDADLLAAIDAALAPTTIALTLPKVEVESSLDLGDPLAAIGLEDLFSAPDLGGMADEPAGLVISRVLHRARLRVDEAGTEAAAATVVLVALGAMPEEEVGPPLEFKVDRPFLVLIRDDRRRLPLFTGRIVDPATP